MSFATGSCTMNPPFVVIRRTWHTSALRGTCGLLPLERLVIPSNVLSISALIPGHDNKQLDRLYRQSCSGVNAVMRAALFAPPVKLIHSRIQWKCHTDKDSDLSSAVYAGGAFSLINARWINVHCTIYTLYG